MKKILVLVEGQTEETFVRDVLDRHLQTVGSCAIPKILVTKVTRQGTQYKGGVRSYDCAPSPPASNSLFGCTAEAAKWRPLVVPPPPPAAESASQDAAAPPAKPRPATHRCRYRSYAELIRRTFAIDRDCPRCRAAMKLRAIVTKPESIERILRSLGEATLPPPLAPAHGPPYVRSPVFRRKPHHRERARLFDDA
jgi:hypothetical protein